MLSAFGSYGMKRIVSSVIAAVCIACSLTGCQDNKNSELVEKTGFFFDTIISIRIAHDDAEELLEETFAICSKFEDTFSRTRESSELYQLNHRISGQVTVSKELGDLITSGFHYYDITQGKFDITVAPLLDLWDYKSEDPAVPDQNKIQEAVSKIDLAQVHDEGGGTFSFDNQETQIDVGALAKGYMSDRIKDYLVSKGVTSGTINLGGNVLTIGSKTDGSSWKVGIQKPFAERNEILAYVESKGGSVVTSGTYERYFEKDGKIYHHILDPDTGYPVDNDIVQVTILSDKSDIGDGLSTSCLLLGLNKGKELIEQMDGVEAVFVTDAGDIVTTGDVKLIKK